MVDVNLNGTNMFESARIKQRDEKGQQGVTTITMQGKLKRDSDANEVEIVLLTESVLTLTSFEISADPFPKTFARRG